jgi:hypothetical protein
MRRLIERIEESEGTSDAGHSFANRGPRPGPSQEEVAAMVEKIAEKVGAEVKKDKYEITITVDSGKIAEANAMIKKAKLDEHLNALKSKRNSDGTRVAIFTFGRSY